MREVRDPVENPTFLPLFDGGRLELIDWLSTPLWLYDLEAYRMIWGNRAALGLWKAASLADFCARDVAPVSVGVRQRMDILKHELEQGREVVENWTLFPAGRPVLLSCKITGFRLADGHVAMMVEAMPKDASAEQAAELRMVEAVRHTPMLVSLFDLHGVSLMHNPAAHDWLHSVGLDEDMQGDLFLAMFDDAVAADRLRRRALKAGAAKGKLRARGQQFRLHAVQLRRVSDPVSGGLCILAAQFDMTQQDRLERRLERALQREKIISDNQRYFLSLTSHEFRTPLSIIDGAARRILRFGTELDPRLVERAEAVRGAVARMLAAVEKTLTASRIEEGQIAFGPVASDLSAIIQQAVATQSDLARGRSILFERTALPELMLDRILIEQCLDNLISNAIKYSYADTPITVSATADRHHVSVTVRNEGIGIPREDLPRIGDRFFRANNAGGMKGTGIGLHTVRYFMGLHGGTVAVRSCESEWTEVELRFPTQPAHREGRPAGGGRAK